MAKLPVYTQKYQPGSRRAGAEDFGAMEGQAKQGFGDAMLQFNIKRQERNNTIQRVLTEDAYARERHQAHTDLIAKTAPEELANPNLLAEQEKYWRQRREEIIANFSGTEADKIELTKKLSSINTDYYKRDSTAISKAQFSVIKTRNDSITAQYSDMAGDDPDNMQMYIDQGLTDLDQLAPAMSPEVLDEAKRNLIGQAIHSAADTLIKQGHHQKALDLLNSEDAAKSLTPQTMRSLKTSAIGGEAKVRNAAEEAVAKKRALIEFTERKLNRKLTPVEISRHMGIASTTPTLEELVGQFTKFGIELDSNEVKVIGNLIAKDPKRTQTKKEDQLAYFRENVNRFEKGEMDEMEEREFIDTYDDYMSTPMSYRMGDGTIISEMPEPPRYISKALEMRGVSPAKDPMQRQADRQQQAMSAEMERQTTRLSSSLGGLYKTASLIAGPGAVVKAAIAKLPFAGDYDEGQAAVVAQQEARHIQQRLVKAVVFNSKYPVALVQQARDEFPILETLWGNWRSYRAKLEEIDTMLEKAANDTQKQILQGEVLLDDQSYSDLKRNYMAIMDYRSAVNIPRITINSPDDVANLPPNTMFKTKSDKPGQAWYTDEGGNVKRMID